MKTIADKTQAKELAAKGALFFVNHSGGKDSQAMYLALRDVIPAEQIVIVHADLGEVEWAGLKEHIRATTDGHEIEVALPVNKAGEVKTLLGEVLRKHADNQAKGKVAPPWFSASMRWCTSDFKRTPIEKVIRRVMKERGATIAVSCMGLRAQESDERTKGLDKDHFRATGEAVTFAKNERLSNQSRAVFDWIPIHDWLETDVFRAIREADQEPHVMYSKGMTRLSCAFCCMASKGDLTTAAKHAPALYKKYVEVERATGFTMRAGMTLEQTTGIKVEDVDAIAEDDLAA